MTDPPASTSLRAPSAPSRPMSGQDDAERSSAQDGPSRREHRVDRRHASTGNLGLEQARDEQTVDFIDNQMRFARRMTIRPATGASVFGNNRFTSAAAFDSWRAKTFMKAGGRCCVTRIGTPIRSGSSAKNARVREFHRLRRQSQVASAPRCFAA
jgi:hypothetical protein